MREVFVISTYDPKDVDLAQGMLEEGCPNPGVEVREGDVAKTEVVLVPESRGSSNGK